MLRSAPGAGTLVGVDKVLVFAKEKDLPYEMAEDRYDGTTGGDAEQDTPLTCGKRAVEDKAEIPIAGSKNAHRQFQAR